MGVYPPQTDIEVLEFMLEGNQRFRTGKFDNPAQNVERRRELAEAQHPFTAVLCCSDSRVPPEIIFDKRVGDLFVVRNAGNVLDDVSIGSIEYAVEHLGVPLIIVLGHEKCGAVTAAVQGSQAHGHLGSVLRLLQPAVEKAKAQSGDAVLNAVDANVTEAVARLQACEPVLACRVRDGRLKILGLRYSLDTGAVLPLTP